MARGAEISVGEIGPTLDHLYEHENTRKHAVMLIGPSGIGKTEAPKDWASQRGLKMFIQHPVVYEPVDVQGIPMPTKEGKARFLPFADLWPWEDGSVLFLDELNRASTPTMNALLRVVLERRVGAFELPADLFVIAACNPVSAVSQVNTLSSAMMGRFLPFHVNANVDDWIVWASRKGIHPDVLGFVVYNRQRLNPEGGAEEAATHMVSTPTPRSWAKVSDLVENVETGGSLEKSLVQAAVGRDAALEFLAWRKVAKDLPRAEDILEGKVALPRKSLDVSIAAAVSVVSLVIEKAGVRLETGVEWVGKLLNLQALDNYETGMRDAAWPGEVVSLSAMMVRAACPAAFMVALSECPAWSEQHGQKLVELNKKFRFF